MNRTVVAFGEVIQDQVLQLNKSLVPDGQVDGVSTFSSGGCAANVVWAAKKFGSPARFVGHSGADAVGQHLI